MKKYNEFINEQVNWNWVLMNSAEKGDLEGVKQASDNGASMYHSAVQYASHNGHLEVMKYLIKKGANIHDGKDYALRLASRNGKLELVKYLVEQGADIHAVDDLALQWASKNDQLDVVEYLCEYIIQKEPSYIPKIIQYIPDDLKEKYPHLFAASDMDLL